MSGAVRVTVKARVQDYRQARRCGPHPAHSRPAALTRDGRDVVRHAPSSSFHALYAEREQIGRRKTRIPFAGTRGGAAGSGEEREHGAEVEQGCGGVPALVVGRG